MTVYVLVEHCRSFANPYSAVLDVYLARGKADKEATRLRAEKNLQDDDPGEDYDDSEPHGVKPVDSYSYEVLEREVVE